MGYAILSLKWTLMTPEKTGLQWKKEAHRDKSGKWRRTFASLTFSLIWKLFHTGLPNTSWLSDPDHGKSARKSTLEVIAAARADKLEKPAVYQPSLASICSQGTIKCRVHRKIPKTQLLSLRERLIVKDGRQIQAWLALMQDTKCQNESLNNFLCV